MNVRQSLGRVTVNGCAGLAGSRIGRRPPVEYLARLLSNRVAPRAAQFAFTPGVNEVNGVRMWFPEPMSGGSGGEYHMALGTYEHREIRYVVDRLPRGGGFVDVGAHFGYFSLAAAAKVGAAGTVISIEPTPSSADVLRRNVRENGFEEIVTVVEGGASDAPGTGSLVMSGHSEMLNTLEFDELAETAGVLDVDLVTVDSVLEEAGWPEVHILKMDVEGYEKKVLIGAEQTLQRFPSAEVLFEASGQPDGRLEVSLNTVNFLAERGFEFFEIDRVDRGEPSSIDRLVERMQMPRWQDALFNVVARRRATEPSA